MTSPLFRAALLRTLFGFWLDLHFGFFYVWFACINMPYAAMPLFSLALTTFVSSTNFFFFFYGLLAFAFTHVWFAPRLHGLSLLVTTLPFTPFGYPCRYVYFITSSGLRYRTWFGLRFLRLPHARCLSGCAHVRTVSGRTRATILHTRYRYAARVRL